MLRISRRRYFKLMDDIIVNHCWEFSDQPNYPLMREVAETERQYRREAWPRPLGVMYHIIIREYLVEIERNVLQQFSPDAFAGTPLPARPVRNPKGCTRGAWMEDLPADIPYWDPFGVHRGHLDLLCGLHRLERQYLGKADYRFLEF
ncbi:hypothetical protein RI103_02435 [Paraburkholderia sp. FT54]|uniref:hypothetical protein n=1 Tax=Paraburkholderia sp. FT54 TaxID=3074437 RepID=UPI002877CF6B|nr:hypothetical protein [Paraburkholderia sp. FT54]WNC90239.1 hypothetical protein RI103_02435 [Paraburkholderia sp. FT54]